MNRKTDSVTHHEERRAMMQLDAEEKAAVDAQRHEKQAAHKKKVREAETDRLEEATKGLVRPGETRDMLLERIRDMRQKEAEAPTIYPPLHPIQQARLEEEQEAGRQAVARAVALEEANRLRMQEAREADRQREGTMVPVYQPNPENNAQFPASGATLGKKK